jgi:hypothetical protein
MENLFIGAKITRVINTTAAGTTAVNGSVIDMQGFENVSFTALFGAITSTAVTGIKAQQGNASDGSDMADLTGTAIAIADTGSNKALAIDVIKPEKRYVRLVVTRGTANAVIDGAIAMQYGARVEPVTNDTTIADAKLVISPVEGTA